MKQKTTIAIMVIALLATLIAMSIDAYGLTLTVSIPEATKDNKIIITGTTDAGVQIEIILNNARVAETTSDSQGNFVTEKITLVRENNTIQIKATDPAGEVRILVYEIYVDMRPPAVNYGQIPAGTQTRALAIAGTASEVITLKYRLNNTLNYTSLGRMNRTFTVSIDLQDGLNKLELLAEDKAGNTDIQNFDITYDIVKPNFISTNLNSLEPCYFDFPLSLSKKVDITGRTSEKASIIVYVNNESPKIGVTADDGAFRIKDVRLTNKIRVQTNATQTSFEFGNKYANTIRVIAKDLAGNEETTEKTITCGTCGGGASGYTFTLGAIVPTILSPRLLVQGMEMLTIPFNASYRGLNRAALGTIRATRPALAPEFAKDYDNDRISEPFVIAQPSRDRQSATGVIQIQIPKFDPLGEAEPDAATFRREQNVSMHRYGECGLGQAELQGCMKLFLTVEIPYQEQTTMTYLDPNMQQTGSNIKIERKTQTICIAPVEIAIDPIIPERYTPRRMVNEVLRWINNTLEFIDRIETPLSETQKGLTYTCMGSIGVVTLNRLAEFTACTIGAMVSKIGDAPWNEEIAVIDGCSDVYAEEFDKEKDSGPGVEGNGRMRNSCNACSELKNTRKWLQYEIMNRACDRVGCPSAKSFKRYILEKGGGAREITTTITDYFKKVKDSAKGDSPEAAAMRKAVDDKKTKIFKDQGVKEKIYTGNDCGFVNSPKLIITTYNDASGAKGIKSLYQSSKDPTTRDYCVDYTRAAKPECCGIEYNREWSTSCGLGQIGGSNIFLLDTFDELEESTCLSAQQAGKSSEMSCGGLWNALAGFCEPNTGNPTSEVIYTGISYQPMKTDSYDNKAYIFVVPKTDTKNEVSDYQVQRGYSVRAVQYRSNATRYAGRSRELTESLYEVHDKDLTSYFKETDSAQEQTFGRFKTALCEGLAAGGDGCTEQRARNAYDRVREATGAPDKEYIVKPDSNILRAIQCLCIPAVRAWVQEWETILTMLKQCLISVQTGQGDAGVCNQFISQAICDRLYDLIKCFTNKFGAAGAGRRVTGDMGIGAVIGILTNTASDINTMVTSRYGEQGMWNSLINEKQLVKGICMWAFTGEWDLALDQVAEQSVAQQTPIESTSLLGECKKYFRGFSPATQPSGQANWVYECDTILVAGAPLNYRLKLQCSDDYSCREADGYRNKECDCVKKGKIIIIIEAGTLQQGDYLNKKITHMVQAGQGAGIRYDTAILEYEWENPQTRQTTTDDDTRRYITQAEGAAPFEYCSFDPFTLTFRCQFGQQNSGIKIEKVTADYSRKHDPRGTRAFQAAEPFRFEIQVQQRMPDNYAEQQEAKKYLYYKIWNHVGNLVARTTPENGTKDSFVFESNGDYTKPVEIALDPAAVEASLKQRTGEKLIGWPREGDNAVEPSEYIDSYDIKENNQDIPAILTLEGNDIKLYKFRSATPGTAGFPKGEEIDTYGYTGPHEYKWAVAPSADKRYNITLTLNKMPDTGRVEIYLPRKTAGAQSPWETDTPADWKIEFTMHDADRYGQPTMQTTVSPQGDIQQKTLTFKVMSNPGVGLEEQTTPTTAPAAPGTTAVPPGGQTAQQSTDKYKLQEGDIAIMQLPDYTTAVIEIEEIIGQNAKTTRKDNTGKHIEEMWNIQELNTRAIKIVTEDEWPVTYEYDQLEYGVLARKITGSGRAKILSQPSTLTGTVQIQWISHDDQTKINTIENIPTLWLDIVEKIQEI